jgi:formylglycine-generating enzyme
MLGGAIAMSAASVVLAGCIIDFDNLSNGCRGAAERITTASGSFCIDRTEVTRGEYKRFLADRQSDTSGQTAKCDWNTSYVPALEWPPAEGEGELPVVAVDWCDAYAYCGWAGKQLCGQVSGGAVSLGLMNDATASAWYAACSHGGERAYPYGTTFASGACVGKPALALSPVGAAHGCEGGFTRLFDLSGNVEEWVDSCESDGSTPPAQECCLARGGSFDSDGSALACAATELNLQYRNVTEAWRGFRCCGR